MCKSANTLYLNVIKSECVTQVLINPFIETRTRHSRRAYHPTYDNILMDLEEILYHCEIQAHVESIQDKINAHTNRMHLYIEIVNNTIHYESKTLFSLQI
jgi:hypothetical protein